MQSSLNKGVDLRGYDHPKITGHHECFEGLRKQESDDIFLKFAIALPFQEKKKTEKKKFLKDLGNCVVEVDLVPNEVSNCKLEEEDEDFSSDDE